MDLSRVLSPDAETLEEEDVKDASEQEIVVDSDP